MAEWSKALDFESELEMIAQYRRPCTVSTLPLILLRSLHRPVAHEDGQNKAKKEISFSIVRPWISSGDTVMHKVEFSVEFRIMLIAVRSLMEESYKGQLSRTVEAIETVHVHKCGNKNHPGTYELHMWDSNTLLSYVQVVQLIVLSQFCVQYMSSLSKDPGSSHRPMALEDSQNNA
ncbi:hypothetical protein J6590_048019 [Homalodisca vitripennis]|nr:hypothetical protein J6590_048019 [Homalodisca vitripennis]